MSLYVLMKILESSPSRYDQGMCILTLGKLNRAYDRIASHIQKNWRVLDLGCGTGTLAVRVARNGAQVKGIDINPAMLEIAGKRVSCSGLAPQVEWCEMGVAELEREISQSYDVVMSSFCFSELSRSELLFTLRETYRILKQKGLLIVIDEVKPGRLYKKVLNSMIRLPLVIICYLITQSSTRSIKGLPGTIEESGFQIESIRMGRMEAFIELTARRPVENHHDPV